MSNRVNQDDFLTKELFEAKMAFLLETLDGITQYIDEVPELRRQLDVIEHKLEEVKRDGIRLSNLQTYHKDQLHKSIGGLNKEQLELDRKIQRIENDKRWIIFLFGLGWALFIAWYQTKN